MAFSFKRQGYIENGIDKIMDVDLLINGYRNDSILEAAYKSPALAKGMAKQKLNSYITIPEDKPEQKTEIKKIQTNPIIPTKKKKEEKYKTWYKTFIAFMGDLF